MMRIHKYPRTYHLQGSRLQPGDEDLDAESWASVLGRYIVAEEKLDGANSGISFDTEGKLYLQSRGHYLTGGPREKHFNLFKQWANGLALDLWPVLGSRYVVYGEWLFAKHTIFYDELPNYFMEFDILDTETHAFLSTDARAELLAGLPITPVPVVWRGVLERPEQLLECIGPSLYKSAEWRERLAEQALARKQDPERIARETDPSDLMEGLYIKVEEDGHVQARYKYVRADFLTVVQDSGTHWLRRPIVPNLTRDRKDDP